MISIDCIATWNQSYFLITFLLLFLTVEAAIKSLLYL
jgi:hypothetical protein